jgi:hypothetical protein
MSQSKISKMELGFLLPSVDDVERLCGVYGIEPKERDELVAITRGLRAQQSTKVILARGAAEYQRRVEALEKSSTLIRSFQPTMVIGLLQTAAYARLVFAVDDSVALSDAEVDESVAVRADRQTVLGDGAKQFALIMTEGALRWQAGSAALMAEQVEAIATAAHSGRVGIIPWTTPMRVFPRHGFHIYDTDAVIVGTENATATMTGEADVATYVELFATLQESALFGADAVTHLERIAADYRHLAGEGP